MLLSEVTFIRPSKDEFYDALDKFVEKYGLEQVIGNSASVIFPTNANAKYVWRVWAYDEGYEKFLSYIKAHPHNKHLPNLLSRLRNETVKFKAHKLTIKYLKLEKLSELQNADPLYKILELILDTGNVETLHTLDDIKSCCDSAEASTFIDQQADFFEVFVDLVKHGANDLHTGNVMKRGPDYVITDPFSS